LSQADVACYTAKENGRNRVIVYGVEPSPHHAQIFVASTLKQALEQNRFRLFGQPIVSLAADPSAAPLHCEILIRLLGDEDHVMLPKYVHSGCRALRFDGCH
jgi:predicted signal transduction protein with EAL and GGDEF domain